MDPQIRMLLESVYESIEDGETDLRCMNYKAVSNQI
jgi:hypothetical protein